MGINNRQRRRNKQRQRQRTERVRPGPSGPRRSHGDSRYEGAIRDAVLSIVVAFPDDGPRDRDMRQQALRSLETRVPPASVGGAVAWWLDCELDRAWNRGWQPADVMRVVRRELGVAHVAALTGVVADSAAFRPEATRDSRWAAQVHAIREDNPERTPTSAEGVEALALWLRLPPLPRLPAYRSGKAFAGDDRAAAMLERVRALLAKAESTTFGEEADALTAKAQELMARYAIDQAMLDAATPGDSGPVAACRIGIDDPYAAPKSVLLDEIARANRCRAVWSKHFGFTTVFGPPSTLEMVEVLFTSLLIQGTEAMLHAGPTANPYGRPRTRSFRQSFLLSYAGRIGERLEGAMRQAEADGVERHGDALLPVLAGEAHAVDEAVRAAYPAMSTYNMAINNHAGWAAGRAAAELASLSVGDPLPAGGRP